MKINSMESENRDLYFRIKEELNLKENINELVKDYLVNKKLEESKKNENKDKINYLIDKLPEIEKIKLILNYLIGKIILNMSLVGEIKLQPDYITKYGVEYHILYHNYYKNLVPNKNRKINFKIVNSFWDDILYKEEEEEENNSIYYEDVYQDNYYEDNENYIDDFSDIEDDNNESENSDSDYEDEVTISKKYQYN